MQHQRTLLTLLKVGVSEVYHTYFYIYEKIYILSFPHLVRVC